MKSNEVFQVLSFCLVEEKNWNYKYESKSRKSLSSEFYFIENKLLLDSNFWLNYEKVKMILWEILTIFKVSLIIIFSILSDK
jgi:hypothetical protein